MVVWMGSMRNSSALGEEVVTKSEENCNHRDNQKYEKPMDLDC